MIRRRSVWGYEIASHLQHKKRSLHQFQRHKCRVSITSAALNEMSQRMSLRTSTASNSPSLKEMFHDSSHLNRRAECSTPRFSDGHAYIVLSLLVTSWLPCVKIFLKRNFMWRLERQQGCDLIWWGTLSCGISAHIDRLCWSPARRQFWGCEKATGIWNTVFPAEWCIV
jgi:hypothetical protein